MNDPHYRIATLCPGGLSPQLQGFLSRLVQAGAPLTVRDLLAIRLTETFRDSGLSFAGTIIAWLDPSYSPAAIQDLLAPVTSLTCANSPNPVSFEHFTKQIPQGTIAFGVFMPLADLSEEARNAEYANLSALANHSRSESLLEWAFGTLVQGALTSDPAGIALSILGSGPDLAERKLKELVEKL